MSQRNKQRAQRNRKNKRPATSRRNANLMPLTRPVRERTWTRRGMPHEMDVQLQYTSLSSVGTGVQTAFDRYNPNSYIPQYSGTQAAAEFTNYATLYDFYRVIKFRVEIDLVNLDTTPVTVVFLCHNEDFSGSSLGDLSGNPYAVTKMLGSANGSAAKVTWRKTMNVATLVGSTAPETADSYRAIINANPADVVWAGYGLFAGANMTNGTNATVRITQWIRFYNADLTSQTTAPSHLTSKQQLDLIQARRQSSRNTVTPSSSRNFADPSFTVTHRQLPGSGGKVCL